jgi:hypothetical protein
VTASLATSDHAVVANDDDNSWRDDSEASAVVLASDPPPLPQNRDRSCTVVEAQAEQAVTWPIASTTWVTPEMTTDLARPGTIPDLSGRRSGFHGARTSPVTLLQTSGRRATRAGCLPRFAGRLVSSLAGLRLRRGCWSNGSAAVERVGLAIRIDPCDRVAMVASCDAGRGGVIRQIAAAIVR